QNFFPGPLSHTLTESTSSANRNPGFFLFSLGRPLHSPASLSASFYAQISQNSAKRSPSRSSASAESPQAHSLNSSTDLPSVFTPFTTTGSRILFFFSCVAAFCS